MAEVEKKYKVMWEEREKEYNKSWDARDAVDLKIARGVNKAWEEREQDWKAEWDAREEEWREMWRRSGGRWNALEEAWGKLQLEDIPVMELAKAAFAMFVLLCLDVLAMFASVCTLVRNLGASE